MKARVKATGEIITVGPQRCSRIDPDYWTRLEHQAAIAAMHGLCANYTEFTKDNDGTLSNTEMITENARIIAHALVEKMKEERK